MKEGDPSLFFSPRDDFRGRRQNDDDEEEQELEHVMKNKDTLKRYAPHK